jgi:ribokinase
LNNPASPFTVVSIGDLVVDIVVQIPSLPVEAARHQLAENIQVEPGGAGNFLIAGSRLGMQMVGLGVLGEDMFGRLAAEKLRQEGIDLSGAVVDPGSTTTTVVALVDKGGRHVFLGKYGVGPRVLFTRRWQDAILQGQAAFSYGYSLREERTAAVCLEALQFAHDHGIRLFFDPGPEMAFTTPEQKQIALQAADTLLLTEEEIPILAGGREGIDAARSLLEQGPRQVCVKRGPRGCAILTPDGTVEHPGYPVEVRDTSAAGDSFAAAYIYASLNGWPLDDVAAFANAMGAAKVQKTGSGSQVPTAAEVRLVLEEFNASVPF